MRSRQNEGRAYQEWDEDADVDESGEVLSAANNIRIKLNLHEHGHQKAGMVLTFLILGFDSQVKASRQ